MSHYCDDTYAVYDESTPTARKPHACAACGETIAAGATYTRVQLVFDGTAETIKRCVRCQRLHEHLREKGYGDDLWPDERLACGQIYEDEWGDLPDEIAALAFWLPSDEVSK